MKKYILLLVPFMVLILGIKSYAYSEQDVTNLRNTFNQYYGVQLNETLARTILDRFDNNDNYYLGFQKSSSFYAVIVGTEYNNTSTMWNFYGWKGLFYNPPTDTTLSSTWDSTPSTQGLTINSDNHRIGPWSSWRTVPIDWDTVYYSANIQAPNFDVTYRELSSTPIVDVPLDVHMNFVPNNVYIEMDAVYRIPERIDAVYGRIGGYEYYTNPSDKAHLYQKVIDKEDMILASNASESYIHLALTDAWEDLYDLIPISELDWYFESDYSQEIKDKLKNRYENLRKICCFYGNEVQIIVRYFTIVNNTQFVVGPWRIWDCAKPNSFTDELPTWYEPYLPASGTTSTSTDTGSNSQSEPDVITIPYGDGEPTGVYYNPNTTITVNPNVPNYPDYPTIATYNKDHLLIDAMNGVKSLNGFFGEMVEFLTVSFAFIPGYIWTIIAVGFSLSIIVMFLKIL